MDTPPQPDPMSPSDEDSNYTAASQSTADFIQNVAPLQAQKQKKRKRKWIILVILVLLAAGGAGGYIYLKPAEKKTANPAPAPSPTPQAALGTEELSEHYVSQDLSLALDHPKTWQIDDATAGKLTITSPLVKLADTNDDQTDSKVLITILRTGSDPEGFTANDATATVDAEKIAYTKPSQNQRKETHLSFISFGASNGMDAIFITGDAGYQKDQAVPKTDVARADPIISVTFLKCTGTNCPDKLSLSPEAWASTPILETTKTILKSLTID